MNGNSVEKKESLSDIELVSLINNGDYECLQYLLDRYMGLIVSTAKKFSVYGAETEDLIQEGVTAVFSAVRSYDGSLSSFSSFVSLCISRSMNTLVKSSFNKKHIPDKLLTSIDDVQIADNSNPESIIIEKESYASFTDAVRAKLSDLEYRVFCLFLDGNSYSSIAEKLDVSSKSVDNALKRIREKLKTKN